MGPFLKNENENFLIITFYVIGLISIFNLFLEKVYHNAFINTLYLKAYQSL